jgi:hypothetical protein
VGILNSVKPAGIVRGSKEKQDAEFDKAKPWQHSDSRFLHRWGKYYMAGALDYVACLNKNNYLDLKEVCP